MRLIAERNRRARLAGRQDAFTIVELTLVVVLSMVMLAGMIGLVTAAFGLFNTQKNLQAVNDSSRRILSAMTRQMKSMLHLDDAVGMSTASQLSFWGDIDNDNPTATSENLPGNTHYTDAEHVRFYLSGGKVMQETIQPASEGGATTNAVLGAYGNSLTFYYYGVGQQPDSSGIAVSNANVGSIKIVLGLRKPATGQGVARTYTDQVFLRVTTRDWTQ